MKNFKEFIESHKDFPHKGIIFRDTLKILQYPKIFNEIILKMCETEIIRSAEAILAIDARGFIFGTAISNKSIKPMVVARKEGKLPGKLIIKDYSLEYGNDRLCVQEEAIMPFKSFAIVDDLIATGGTINSAYQILRSKEKSVTGIITLVELNENIRKEKLNIPVKSFIKYD